MNIDLTGELVKRGIDQRTISIYSLVALDTSIDKIANILLLPKARVQEHIDILNKVIPEIIEDVKSRKISES